ncbi:MAG TPA: hypothetical protein VNG13_03830 [Mycobacteriales bacterium]|nr:hypothetical protein [Mycobacteriales bacterium]
MAEGTAPAAARIKERAAGQARVARLTRWAVVGGLTAVGVTSAAAAAALPGRSGTPAGSHAAGTANQPNTAVTQSPSQAQTPDLQPPAQQPGPATNSYPPVVTSGGS